MVILGDHWKSTGPRSNKFHQRRLSTTSGRARVGMGPLQGAALVGAAMIALADCFMKPSFTSCVNVRIVMIELASARLVSGKEREQSERR